MGWSLLGGHYCEPDAVRKGSCPVCGTTWSRSTDEWDHTMKGLRGVDIRDENGERYPLF